MVAYHFYDQYGVEHQLLKLNAKQIERYSSDLINGTDMLTVVWQHALEWVSHDHDDEERHREVINIVSIEEADY